MRQWLLPVLGVALVIFGLALVFAGSVAYTRTQVEHECKALQFIIGSDIQNAQFLRAVEYWASSDGC